VLLLAATISLAGCQRAREPPLFELLLPRATGVAFVNEVPEQDTALDIVNFLNYYDGGGVAAGDVDGDGLPDLYFTSNVGSNRLYRNKGNYQFEDITERAGVADPAISRCTAATSSTSTTETTPSPTVPRSTDSSTPAIPPRPCSSITTATRSAVISISRPREVA